jgi:hypothetical protein
MYGLAAQTTVSYTTPTVGPPAETVSQTFARDAAASTGVPTKSGPSDSPLHTRVQQRAVLHIVWTGAHAITYRSTSPCGSKRAQSRNTSLKQYYLHDVQHGASRQLEEQRHVRHADYCTTAPTLGAVSAQPEHVPAKAKCTVTRDVWYYGSYPGNGARQRLWLYTSSRRNLGLRGTRLTGQHAQSCKLLAAVREGDVDLVHDLINEGASTTSVDKVHGLASSTGRQESSREPVSCLACPAQHRRACNALPALLWCLSMLHHTLAVWFSEGSHMPLLVRDTG